jgi:hypothetical protein
MGLFKSDDERNAARVTKALLDRLPAHVRREIMGNMRGTDVVRVLEAVQAAERDIATRK